MRYNKGDFEDVMLAAVYAFAGTLETRYIVALASGYTIVREEPDMHQDYYRVADQITLNEYDHKTGRYNITNITTQVKTSLAAKLA
jgi:hypothetical protein